MPYYTVCTSLYYRYDALLGSKGDWDELCLRLVFSSISCTCQEHNQWLLSALSLLNTKTLSGCMSPFPFDMRVVVQQNITLALSNWPKDSVLCWLVQIKYSIFPSMYPCNLYSNSESMETYFDGDFFCLCFHYHIIHLLQGRISRGW